MSDASPLKVKNVAAYGCLHVLAMQCHCCRCVGDPDRMPLVFLSLSPSALTSFDREVSMGAYATTTVEVFDRITRLKVIDMTRLLMSTCVHIALSVIDSSMDSSNPCFPAPLLPSFRRAAENAVFRGGELTFAESSCLLQSNDVITSCFDLLPRYWSMSNPVLSRECQCTDVVGCHSAFSFFEI